MERQTNTGMAVPFALPRYSAAGAARPRAAAQGGGGPPGRDRGQGLLHGARHARRVARCLVLGGGGGGDAGGRRHAPGLGPPLRQPAGAARLRQVRLLLAQPQGHQVTPACCRISSVYIIWHFIFFFIYHTRTRKYD